MTCYPERSEAESRDPRSVPIGLIPGFLDFARNDSEWLVIHPIQLPSSFTFMSENQFSTPQLQIPLCARPRFFIPPVSGKQIWAALLDDFATNFFALKMPIFRSKNGTRYSGWKPAPQWAQHMEGRPPASLGMRSGRRRAPPSIACRRS